MTRHGVVRTILAALLVLGVGVAIAAAETVQLRVKKMDSDQVVTVGVDGITEELSLDDLADGEVREIAAGEHTVTVRRDRDRLEVLLDGAPIVAPDARSMVWVDEDGITHEVHDGARKVIVMRDDATDAGEARVFAYKVADGALSDDVEIEIESIREHIESGEWEETYDIKVSGPHVMVHSGDGHPGLLTAHATHGSDRVVYRCEETGSVLTVKADDALLDSYIDPVTGCLMEKVATPQVRVLTVIEERADDE